MQRDLRTAIDHTRRSALECAARNGQAIPPATVGRANAAVAAKAQRTCSALVVFCSLSTIDAVAGGGGAAGAALRVALRPLRCAALFATCSAAALDAAPRDALARALGTEGGATVRSVVVAHAPPPPPPHGAADIECETRRNRELREACALCELVESMCASGSADDGVLALVSAAAGDARAAGEGGALLIAAPALFGGWQDVGAAGATTALRVQRAPTGLHASVADLPPTLAGIASALAGTEAVHGAGSAAEGGRDLSRYLLGLESPRRLLELL